MAAAERAAGKALAAPRGARPAAVAGKAISRPVPRGAEAVATPRGARPPAVAAGKAPARPGPCGVEAEAVGRIARECSAATSEEAADGVELGSNGMDGWYIVEDRVKKTSVLAAWTESSLGEALGAEPEAPPPSRRVKRRELEETLQVSVEYCTRKTFHTMHSPEKYEEYFQNVRSAVLGRFPNAAVLGNHGPARGHRPWTMVDHLGPLEDVSRPRLGSFEVTLKSPYFGQTSLFSKLNVGRWPNSEVLVQRAEQLLGLRDERSSSSDDRTLPPLQSKAPVVRDPAPLPGPDAIRIYRTLGYAMEDPRCKRSWHTPRSQPVPAKVQTTLDTSRDAAKKKVETTSTESVRKAKPKMSVQPAVFVPTKPSTPRTRVGKRRPAPPTAKEAAAASKVAVAAAAKHIVAAKVKAILARAAAKPTKQPAKIDEYDEFEPDDPVVADGRHVGALADPDTRPTEFKEALGTMPTGTFVDEPSQEYNDDFEEVDQSVTYREDLHATVTSLNSASQGDFQVTGTTLRSSSQGDHQATATSLGSAQGDFRERVGAARSEDLAATARTSLDGSPFDDLMATGRSYLDQIYREEASRSGSAQERDDIHSREATQVEPCEHRTQTNCRDELSATSRSYLTEVYARAESRHSEHRDDDVGYCFESRQTEPRDDYSEFEGDSQGRPGSSLSAFEPGTPRCSSKDAARASKKSTRVEGIEEEEDAAGRNSSAVGVAIGRSSTEEFPTFQASPAHSPAHASGLPPAPAPDLCQPLAPDTASEVGFASPPTLDGAPAPGAAPAPDFGPPQTPDGTPELGLSIQGGMRGSCLGQAEQLSSSRLGAPPPQLMDFGDSDGFDDLRGPVESPAAGSIGVGIGGSGTEAGLSPGQAPEYEDDDFEALSETKLRDSCNMRAPGDGDDFEAHYGGDVLEELGDSKLWDHGADQTPYDGEDFDELSEANPRDHDPERTPYDGDDFDELSEGNPRDHGADQARDEGDDFEELSEVTPPDHSIGQAHDDGDDLEDLSGANPFDHGADGTHYDGDDFDDNSDSKLRDQDFDRTPEEYANDYDGDGNDSEEMSESNLRDLRDDRGSSRGSWSQSPSLDPSGISAGAARAAQARDRVAEGSRSASSRSPASRESLSPASAS